MLFDRERSAMLRLCSAPLCSTGEDTTMTNGDIIKGKMKQAEGKTQDAFGKATDSTEDELKGNLKQAEGKLQEGFGKAKEAVKNTVDDIKAENARQA
jgi:uncharacterized protein YjbJ (UPF0337 family)